MPSEASIAFERYGTGFTKGASMLNRIFTTMILLGVAAFSLSAEASCRFSLKRHGGDVWLSPDENVPASRCSAVIDRSDYSLWKFSCANGVLWVPVTDGVPSSNTAVYQDEKGSRRCDRVDGFRHQLAFTVLVAETSRRTCERTFGRACTQSEKARGCSTTYLYPNGLPPMPNGCICCVP